MDGHVVLEVRAVLALARALLGAPHVPRPQPLEEGEGDAVARVAQQVG